MCQRNVYIKLQGVQRNVYIKLQGVQKNRSEKTFFEQQQQKNQVKTYVVPDCMTVLLGGLHLHGL